MAQENIGWYWLCGVNSTDLDDSGSFVLKKVSGNTCFIDLLDVLPHLWFILTAASVLLALTCFVRFKHSWRSDYILRFPGHILRWLISIFLLICLFASLAEGILTDETYIQSLGGSQPHLYIPPITALMACIISLVYYHHMEVWQAGGMAFVSLLYYATAALGEIGKLINLHDAKQNSVEIARFDLSILQLICYSLLILLDINVIRCKVGRASWIKVIFFYRFIGVNTALPIQCEDGKTVSELTIITLSPSWSCYLLPITVMNVHCAYYQTITSSSLSLVTMRSNGVKSTKTL